MNIKEKDIKILMKDYCTEYEAIKHLKMGTTVFDSDDFEKNIENYLNDWGILEEEERQCYYDMIKNKEPIMDWSIVEYENEIYYIEYVL